MMTKQELISVSQAGTDEEVIRLWLHGKAKESQRAYRKDVDRFVAGVLKPFGLVTLGDLQGFSDLLGSEEAPATKARTLAAVKSLFSFGHKVGYLAYNVGAALRVPNPKDALSRRILEEGDVVRMIALEPKPRNRA